MSRLSNIVVNVASKMHGLALGLKLKSSPPIILLYHGVTQSMQQVGLSNCEGKHMPIELFIHHLRILRRSRCVIPLNQMVEGLASGAAMRNTVAITFDDGYENNASVAAPVLADFNMSAAFFLTTGLIGTDSSIWTDRVEMALDHTTRNSMHLPFSDDPISISNFNEKRHALGLLKSMLKLLPAEKLHEAVTMLVDQLGVVATPAKGNYRFMNWEQARELSAAGFEIGAHTISHPILTKIPISEATVEILGSRDKVLQEVGQCSKTFCFPNGKLTDFNAPLQALCREHFKAALTSERGTAAMSDIFELKRLSPGGLKNGENIEWMLLRGH